MFSGPNRVTNNPAMSACLGAVVWLLSGINFVTDTSATAFIHFLILLAVLVLVPMGLFLTAERDQEAYHPGLKSMVLRWQPISAVLVMMAIYFPKDLLSVLLVTPWFIVTIMIAVLGLFRWRSRNWAISSELCVDVAHMFLVVGGFWLILSRAGINFLGFSHIIVLLTAMHFHFAGFTATLLAGLVGRLLSHDDKATLTMYRYVVFGVILGTPLVALGITFSQLLEVLSAFYLSSAMALMGVIILWKIVRHLHGPVAKAMLGVCGISVILAMLLACMYAYGEFSDNTLITIDQMVFTHGVLNGLGTGFCGLLGLFVHSQESRFQV